VYSKGLSLIFLEVIDLETLARSRQYEAMFLIDSGLAASDWDGVNAAISKILERAVAEVILMRKWDERKLAYDIAGKSRGTYVLCYFKASPGNVHQIEREVQLSEKIMRVLILKADHLTTEDMFKETPAMQAEKGQPVQESGQEHSGRSEEYEDKRADDMGIKGQEFEG